MDIENIFLIFILFGIFQSLLLALYFFVSDSFHFSTRIFSVCFVLLAFIFSLGLFFLYKLHYEYPHFSRIGLPIGALVAPTFALGAEKYFGYPKEKLIWRIIYFAAPLLIFTFLSPYYFLSANEKLSEITNYSSTLNKECVSMNLISIASNFLIFARIYYRLHILSEEFNSKLIGSILQFKKLLHFCLFILGFSFIIFLMNPFQETESFVNALFSIWILVFAWNQIYLKTISLQMDLTPTSKDKYSKSFIETKLLNQYGNKIKTFLMIRENITNPDLNLSILSKHLGISLNLTSQVINRYFSKTFLELIREYRILLAIDYLKNSDFSILRIGHEVGYNSKSSFLRSFREETGTTPSLFKQKASEK